ncbi:MAG TPA: hypothetical protein VKE73_13865 [Myxococcota bacterium]|nr:hypothetical protein [Myxococcota bacterium]
MGLHAHAHAVVRRLLREALPTLLAASCLLVGSGCALRGAPEAVAAHDGDELRPPPLAHAPGWRRRHPDGVEIVYRSELGAYVVVGLDDAYYCDDVFYLWDSGRWLRAPHFTGPWLAVPASEVPANLTRRPGKLKVARSPHDEDSAR